MTMTGDKALQIVELAILRVRYRSHDPRIVDALGSIAGEILELRREHRAAETVDADQ